MHRSLGNGALELLKYLALLLMLGDHINKYLFNATLPALFEAGRVAMPLFGIILAYNLARPAITTESIKRMITRLAIFAALSTPLYIALGGVKYGWWPLNILFTLLVAVVVIQLLGSGRPVIAVLATAIFFAAGAVVEFQWYGLATVVSAWAYFKKPSAVTFTALIISCSSLAIINSNFYSLVALPAVFAASYINIEIPRLKWLFYWFYPLHLLALLLIRIPMAKAGYLFFM